MGLLSELHEELSHEEHPVGVCQRHVIGLPVVNFEAEWLESDQLDYRVLANDNREQFTGYRGVFVPAGAGAQP